MEISIVIALVLLFGGVIALVTALVMARRVRMAVNNRINVIARVTARTAKPRSLVSSLQAEANKLDRLVRQVFAFGIQRSWGVKVRSPTLIVLALLGAFVGWFLLYKVFSLPPWLTVPACLLAGFMLPRSVLARQQRKAERRFTDVFPDAVDTVARMLRAGLPATVAIRTVGADASPPVSTVFTTIADQMRIGIPLSEALDASSQRIGLADFRFFSVAVALQHATGGNLVNTLDMLSQIMRKRRAVRLKAKAVTSEIRLSAYVLGSLPFITAAGLVIIQPGYMTPLINDPRGRVILAIAAGGLFLSVLSMKLMMKSVSSE